MDKDRDGFENEGTLPSADGKRVASTLAEAATAADRLREDLDVLRRALMNAVEALEGEGAPATAHSGGMSPDSIRESVSNDRVEEAAEEPPATKKTSEPPEEPMEEEIPVPMPSFFVLLWLVFVRPLQLRELFATWRELPAAERKQAVRGFGLRMAGMVVIGAPLLAVSLALLVWQLEFPMRFGALPPSIVVGTAAGIVFGLTFGIASRTVTGAVSATVTGAVCGILFGAVLGALAGAAEGSYPHLYRAGTIDGASLLRHDAVAIPALCAFIGVGIGLIARFLALITRDLSKEFARIVVPALGLGVAAGILFASVLHTAAWGAPTLSGGIFFILAFGLVFGLVLGGLGSLLPDPFTMAVIGGTAGLMSGYLYDMASGFIFGFALLSAALGIRLLPDPKEKPSDDSEAELATIE